MHIEKNCDARTNVYQAQLADSEVRAVTGGTW